MSQLSIQSHTLIALAGTHKDTVSHSLCVQSKGNRHSYIGINTQYLTDSSHTLIYDVCGLFYVLNFFLKFS